MAKTRKKTTKKYSKKVQKKKELQRKIVASSICVCLLFLMIVGLGVALINSSLISEQINATTASYITFKNVFEEDDMTIFNLRRLSDNRGKRVTDDAFLEFDVKGDSGTKFDIIIVPINNSIDYKYIKFYLTDSYDNVILTDRLSNVSDKMLEMKLYSGKIEKNKEENKFKLRLWIDKEYKDEIVSSSFEVKLKLK